MTTMLTVKSGINPHMISRDASWFENGSGWDGLVSVGHNVTLWFEGD
jgi:hypothetical protein